MKTFHSIIAVIACAVASGCEQGGPSQRYFGQTPPGSTPTVFAPGIISKQERFEQFLLYAPDGDELIFGVTNEHWSAFTLHSMRLTDKGWTEPLPPPFIGANPGGLTSCWSFDGNRVFFTDTRPSYPPANVFMSVRHGTGWSEPTKMDPPINSDADEWEVACTRNGTLYFSSARPGGYGRMDIYRAPLVDGGYPRFDNYPSVSPDGEYLFFARRTAWEAEEDSDIYWVSAEFIRRLRETARPYDGPTDPPPPLGLAAQLSSPDDLDVQGAADGSRVRASDGRFLC